MTRHDLISPSAEWTIALGTALGERLPAGAVLALSGDLGTGKTTFVRGLAGGLGIDADEVASPTYVLLQAYEGGRLPLYHFDAWMEGREKALFLDGGDEWLHAGGVACIEWAGRVGEWIPEPHLAVTLGHKNPEERTVSLEIVGSGSEEMRMDLEEALAGALATLEPAENPPPPEPGGPGAVSAGR